MNYYLSLSASKQLKEWGCSIKSGKYIDTKSGKLMDELKSNFGIPDRYIRAYDLRDIICNGEMAKAFFGNEFIDMNLFNDTSISIKTFTGFKLKSRAYTAHSFNLLYLIQRDKKEEAEKYLLENCLWNPENK